MCDNIRWCFCTFKRFYVSILLYISFVYVCIWNTHSVTSLCSSVNTITTYHSRNHKHVDAVDQRDVLKQHLCDPRSHHSVLFVPDWIQTIWSEPFFFSFWSFVLHCGDCSEKPGFSLRRFYFPPSVSLLVFHSFSAALVPRSLSAQRRKINTQSRLSSTVMPDWGLESRAEGRGTESADEKCIQTAEHPEI